MSIFNKICVDLGFGIKHFSNSKKATGASDTELLGCKEFIIYGKENPIATLKNSTQKDQFWTFYQLHPLSSDDDIIARLYSEGFWLGKEISFYNRLEEFNSRVVYQ